MGKKKLGKKNKKTWNINKKNPKENKRTKNEKDLTTLPVGTRVVLKGLKNFPEYNGELAEICQLYDVRIQKYHLRLIHKNKDANVDPKFFDVRMMPKCRNLESKNEKKGKENYDKSEKTQSYHNENLVKSKMKEVDKDIGEKEKHMENESKMDKTEKIHAEKTKKKKVNEKKTEKEKQINVEH